MMDLLAILRSGVDSLPDGEHTKGLKSVLSHIEVAYRHLARGQDSKDETAFTDGIYRCNQAYEGSIKEAYRVLAGKDPSKVTPFEIEKHLESAQLFRPRVLGAFTNYRTEWRNPSTHDYTLDFDAAEAFLAIISVSGFAKLLMDQIAETLSYQKAKSDPSSIKLALPKTKKDIPLLEKSAQILIRALNNTTLGEKLADLGESQTLGTVAGLLSAALPTADIELEPTLPADRRYRPDLMISDGDESILIEIKHASSHTAFDRGVTQIETYLGVGNLKNGIYLQISPSGKYVVIPFEANDDGDILALTTNPPPGYIHRSDPPFMDQLQPE